MTWRGSIQTQGSADSRVGIAGGRSQQGGIACGHHVQCGGAGRGSVALTGSRHRRYPRSSFLHGVAPGLCSNACTAFRAFRRFLMKSVTCGLGHGNSRNPTYRNTPYHLVISGRIRALIDRVDLHAPHEDMPLSKSEVERPIRSRGLLWIFLSPDPKPIIPLSSTRPVQMW